MRATLRLAQGAAKNLLQLIIGLVAGVCVYMMVAALTGDLQGWNWVAAILLAPLFTFPAIAIHEAGHAVAAFLSGWIIDRFVVWPFAYAPRTKRLSFVARPIGQGEVGGWVVARPPLGHATRRATVAFLSGGVVANALAAAVCFVLSKFASGRLDTILAVIAVFSLVLVLTNLIPWKIDGQASDGLKLWRLWRSGRHEDRPGRA